MEYTVRPVDASRWPDVAEVMGDKGGHGGCWCMFWRLTNQEAVHAYTPENNRKALEDIVCESTHGGLLLYADEEPIGWCSVGPRPQYPRLMHTKGLVPEDPENENVWSVVCVVVKPGHRRTGAAGRLVQGAVEYAREAGAKRVEGYPLADPNAGKKNALSSGTVSMFGRAGFELIERAGSGRRLVMSRTV